MASPAAKVAYVSGDRYVACCDRTPKVPRRASIVHELICAYKLDRQCTVVSPRIASDEELRTFHSEDYVKFLREVDDERELDAEGYGLDYDCPFFEGLYDYVRAIAGATLTAVDCLLSGKYRVAVNWGGGWHHASKDEAAGFCYVNDIVIGILKLRTKYDRVLYVDLDVHHGNGVEDAFAYTSKVMTVSFHKYAPGFYPGSGSVADIGSGKGRFYTVNVPFHDGVQDAQYFSVFKHVMELTKAQFKPEAVVCQCGADGVAGDPMDSFNLTPLGLGRCVKHVLEWKLPTLVLGGGGYHIPNTARCWTYLLSVILELELSSDIPDNEYFTMFGPGYSLEVTPGNRRNQNTQEYIDEICKTISDRFRKMTQSDS